jgi:hypothetical protein
MNGSVQVRVCHKSSVFQTGGVSVDCSVAHTVWVPPIHSIGDEGDRPPMHLTLLAFPVWARPVLGPAIEVSSQGKVTHARSRRPPTNGVFFTSNTLIGTSGCLSFRTLLTVSSISTFATTSHPACTACLSPLLWPNHLGSCSERSVCLQICSRTPGVPLPWQSPWHRAQSRRRPPCTGTAASWNRSHSRHRLYGGCSIVDI